MLSVLLLAGACSRLDEQTTALSIYVRLSEQEATKADADDGAMDWASLLAKETRINDLRIWVFANDVTGKEKGALLGYLEPKQLNMSNGKVQKFSFDVGRKTDDEYHVLLGCFVRDAVHGFPSRVDKGSLAEEVAAGLSRDTKFRKDEKRAALICVVYGSDDLVRVIVDIRDAEFRGNCTYS